MKSLVLSFVVFLSFSNFSSSQMLEEYPWILTNLSINNVRYPSSSEYYPITDADGNRILLNFNNPGTMSFDTTVCGLLECEFSIASNSLNFEVLSTETTSEACTNLGDQVFENLYFNFFQPLTTYNYSIGCLLSGGACFLAIYAPNGDEAYFWNGLLTTSQNIKIEVSIYPNPVKNELIISAFKDH